MKRLSLLLFVLCAALMADFSLDNVFGSNMVLQRGVPVAFFGKGTPNSKIKASFRGKDVTVVVTADGSWRAEFPAGTADHVNYKAVFADGQKTIELTELIFGDVWFCSGQSNMEMPIGATFRRGWSAQNCEEEVKNANYDELRYVANKRVISHNKLGPASIDIPWEKCNSGTAPRYSATAYFFGRQLLKDEKVPIGLILSPWSGRRIEPFISRDGFVKAGLEHELSILKHFDFDDAAKYDKSEDVRYRTQTKKWYDDLYAKFPNAKVLNEEYASISFNDNDWQTSQPNSNDHFVVRWLRTKIKLNDNMKQGIMLGIYEPGLQYDIFINGKRVCKYDVETGYSFSRNNWVRNPLEALNVDGENTIVIRTELCGDTFARFANQAMNQAFFQNAQGQKQYIRGWKVKDEFSISLPDNKLEKFPQLPYLFYKDSQFPTNIYNGQIDAWTKLPIKGVIWYQGCSNAGDPRYYAQHKALIDDWRTKWNQPDMPFLITQLAGFGSGRNNHWSTYNPTDAPAYAVTRDIQQQLTAIPNVGVACIVDIGEKTNIHPANKQDVGLRLAYEAERIAYGKKEAPRSPVMEKVVPEGKAVRVFFKYAKSLKTSDGKAPAGFAVAGEDGKFVWADAKIDGNTVVVSSQNVAAPVNVRYAYINFHDDLNLQNEAGLPVFPFRSDAVDYSKVK